MDNFPSRTSSPGASCGSPYSEAFSGSPSQYSDAGVEPTSPEFTVEHFSRNFSAQSNDGSQHYGASNAPAPESVEDEGVWLDDCFYKDLAIGTRQAVHKHLHQLIVKFNMGRLGLPCIDTSSRSLTPYSDIAQPKKAGKAGAVKRPMNAFMVFAKAERRHMMAGQPQLHNANISKHLGDVWRLCPESLQYPYKHLAQCLKDLHRQEHPEYKYQPRKKKPATETVRQDSQDPKRPKKRKAAKAVPATEDYHVVHSQATHGQQMASGVSVCQGAAAPKPTRSGPKSPKKNKTHLPAVQQGLEPASGRMQTIHIIRGQFCVPSVIPRHNTTDVKPTMNKSLFSGDVKPVMNKVVVSSDVKPVLNKAIFSNDVKPIINESLVSHGVKPIITESLISHGAKHIINDSLNSHDVKPVTKEVLISPKVIPVIDESLFSNDVKPAIRVPFFSGDVKSIKREPCIPDTQPILCESEPVFPRDAKPSFLGDTATGAEPEATTAEEDLPSAFQEDSARENLIPGGLGDLILFDDNNLLSAMPLGGLMDFTNDYGFDLDSDELVQGDQLQDALDFHGDVDPILGYSHL